MGEKVIHAFSMESKIMSKSDIAREALKNIPSLDKILSTSNNSNKVPSHLLKSKINHFLSNLRLEINQGKIPDDIPKYIHQNVEKIILLNSNHSLRSVINGTGIILNTGLGRAPLSKDMILSVAESIYPYSNLEVNIGSNSRGNRLDHISPIINSLVGSEQSLMVNNNAAAVMIMLNSICKNKKVIISRGEQVEIGGSFRIPDIIESSGCKMAEVGTTNKTKLSDYENAIDKDTAAVLVVHTSNYKVVGFTESVDFDKLSQLCKSKGVELLFDLGSGAILNDNSSNIPFERKINEYLTSGASVVTYSGDKLLGGIQAGILSGKKELIDRIYKNPMYRTLRCDKYRIALMEKILRTYDSRDSVTKSNLALQLFLRSRDHLNKNAQEVIKNLNDNIKKSFTFKITDTLVEAGSGSLPTETIESVAITIKSDVLSSNKISKKLRLCNSPIFNYIKNDIVHIDFKAITDDQLDLLSDQINLCL